MTLALGALVAELAFAGGAFGATRERGTFTTLPDGADLGLIIGGIAQITRADDGTAVKVVVRGLEPGTTYAAHLHTLLVRHP